MSKEASRIRRVIGRLTSHEDIAEILRRAKLEKAIATFAEDGEMFGRSVAICEAAEDALEISDVRLQTTLPSCCFRSGAATADALS
jgi:hypothetical protein